MLGYYVDVAVGFVGNTWELATVYVKDSEIDREIDDECAEITKIAEGKILKSYENHFKPIAFTKTLWISDPEEMEDEEDIS
jgi:hypothetical protein